MAARIVTTLPSPPEIDLEAENDFESHKPSRVEIPHHSSLFTSTSYIIPYVVVVFVTVSPTLVVLYLLDKPSVDRATCRCSCFDTVFKGPYEYGIAGYKHVYFNATANTFKMWSLVAFGVIFLYEISKRIFHLIADGNVRWLMLVAVVGSFHSQYYGWWVHFNYWNDDFYYQFQSQLNFSSTDLLAFVIFVYFLDKNNPMSLTGLLVILDVSLFHIMSNGWYQFSLLGQGKFHQSFRDVFLMGGDVLMFAVALWSLRQMFATRFSSHKGLKGSTTYSGVGRGDVAVLPKSHIAALIVLTMILFYMFILGGKTW